MIRPFMVGVGLPLYIQEKDLDLECKEMLRDDPMSRVFSSDQRYQAGDICSLEENLA